MKLEGCSLYFDGTVVTSPTCWDGANVFGPVGKTLVKSKYPAQQIQVINMTVNAIDENPVPGSDVAAAGGKFQVKYTHVQCVLFFLLSLFVAARMGGCKGIEPALSPWREKNETKKLSQVRREHAVRPLQQAQPGDRHGPALDRVGARRRRVWRQRHAEREKRDDWEAGHRRLHEETRAAHPPGHGLEDCRLKKKMKGALGFFAALRTFFLRL